MNTAIQTLIEPPTKLKVVELAIPYLATDVLREVMRFRRVAKTDHVCDIYTCQNCLAPHLPKVISAITEQQPITFVLPAFPGKSPNLEKVLGILPDMAERQALIFLNQLCDQIQKLYAPGARIILCSDGRVFSDVIGMREEDVTAYHDELERIIAEQNLRHLSAFTLDALCEAAEFDQVRSKLMQQFGKPLETLRLKVVRGGSGSSASEDQEAHRMFCGITRFLVEDSMHAGQTKSRTALQKDARVRAYEVIRRSNAWSELIAERFPEAVRLSIHPQSCGAAKLGIQLLGTESWMTPWHGVAVETSAGLVLMKRREAEELGADLVHDSQGRASHYTIVRGGT